MKLFRICLLSFCLVAFASCKTNITYSIDDSNLNINKKNVSIENYTNEYILLNDDVDAYFYENGNVPLVDLASFVSCIDGYFHSKDVKHEIDSKKYCETLYWMDGDRKLSLTAYWTTNKIVVNDMSFFHHTEEIIGTDYEAHLKLVNIKSKDSRSVVFDLDKYEFDILRYDNSVLVPFPILNVLFCSFNQMNIIYNKSFHFFGSTPDVAGLIKIMLSSLNNTDCPTDVRTASTNGLLFTLDYFYGLKQYKNIDNFKDYIGKEALEDMNNPKSEVYSSAYAKVLINMLDDPHTTFQGVSVYNTFLESTSTYTTPCEGERFKSFAISQADLLNSYNSKGFNDSLVKYQGNVAFIKFDNFLVGSDEYIYDSPGNICDDAWKYDTFILMKKCMADISTHSEIENIVIDLSTNGGGYAVAMYEVLGFMTNNNIEFITENTLSKEKAIESYAIDVNDDGSYLDDDAYTQYNWNILTSSFSFSAANAFSSICKSTGIATLIGEQTGGGMCSIMSCCLMDGTTYNISSTMSIRYIDGDNNYHEVESGITPNYYVERKHFYDLKYMSDFINNGYKE